MHFCKFNMEFLGLGYGPCSGNLNYSTSTFELYACKKCGKLKFKNRQVYSDVYSSIHEDRIKLFEECGYVRLGDLLEKKNTKGDDINA